MEKTFTFYGNEIEFCEHLKKYIENVFCKTCEIELNDDCAIIKIQNCDFFKVIFKRIGYFVRSFSIPNDIKYSIQITTNNPLSSDMCFIEIICNVCEAYSPKEINAIIRDMPLLNYFGDIFSGILEGYSIIWRDHFLEENIGLLNAFVNLGVRPCDILALDKGDETAHRVHITQTFRLLGYKTAVLDNAYLNDYEKQIEYKKILNDFLAPRINKKVVVLDDGAIITGLLDQKYENKLKFAVELTEMGLRRIRKLNVLPCKIYNLAKTELKKSFTYKEISNSVFLRIVELLGANKLIGRPIIIIGYGDLGSRLAANFRNYGANVIVTDCNYIKLIKAAEDGYPTYENLHDAISTSKPFLLVGASGYESINTDDLKAMPNNSYVTSSATADINVFNHMESKAIIKMSKYGTVYDIDGKNITLLGNGRSINLYNSEAIPNQANDLFKAATLITVIHGVQRETLEKNLELDIVDKWIEESEIYKKYYMTYIKQKEI